MATDERTEWRRARDGDRGALDALFRRHERSLYRFGLRMCGNEEAAREVLQRTLLTAFEQLRSFRGEARISTWLYALARSHCSRLHRAGRSVRTEEIPDETQEHIASLEPGQDAQAASAEMAALVSTAIGLLPERQREAVVLKDVEDLALEEAARVVGLAVPAFKSRLHRARQQLQQNLATLLQDAPPEAAVAACPSLQATLRKTRDAGVNRAACAAIEAHLEQCETCRHRLGPLRDAASLCRRLPGGDVPAPVRRAVRAAVRGALCS